VAPLILGKVLKDTSPFVNSIVEKNKMKLTLVSSTALAAIPFQQASASASSFGTIPIESFVGCLTVFSLIHGSYLGVNYVIAKNMMKLPLEEQKTFVIMSSQKSLPVALSILSFIPQNVVPGLGLASIPVIIAHLTQTLADSALAAKWADLDNKSVPKKID
jgi:sodium/bile acid cotransporter 7